MASRRSLYLRRVLSRHPSRLLAAIAALGCALSLASAPARAAPPVETPGARALLGDEEAGLGTTVPELGEAPPLADTPITRVEVFTAGGRWEAPLALRSVKPGERLSAQAARRLMREALATGRFARANVELLPDGAGVVLRLNVLPRRMITALKVNGGVLEEPDTLDAARVAVGGELTAPEISAVAARLRRHYEAHGYPSAQVRLDTVDTDQPDKVVLSIEIVPGKARTVRQRSFRVESLSDRSDEEVGNLRDAYKVSVGARVDEPLLADADRELGESLRQHGFFRAEVRHVLRHQGDKSDLVVVLKPGPRLVPAFDGNRAFDGGELEAALNLEKQPDDRAGELIERLRVFYVRRGFLDAEVGMVEKGKPEDPVHHLAFTVRERRRVKVTKRVFPCLDAAAMSADDVGREIGSFLEEDLPGSDTFQAPDPRQLLGLFGPTAGSGGRGAPADLNPLVTYAPETYERALKHLKDLLHSKGYMNAVVGPISVIRATCDRRSRAGECLPVFPPDHPTARCLKDSLGLPVPEPLVPDTFTCRPDAAHDVECSPELTVRIPIAPGPQTQLWDLAFEGNNALPSAQLAKLAKLPLGTPISSTELEAARVRVLDAYRLRGYAYAEVRAQAEPSPDRSRARIRFHVTERERVMVTGFVVKGAVRTDEKLVLRRVALKLGAPYRQDWARQSEERVATLGTFSSVSVNLEDADVPEKRKRVVITVVENATQYIEARPGFSTGDGLRGSFEWGHRNLGGQAISLTLRLQLSYLFDFLILDDTVRANYDQNLSSALLRLERRNSAAFTFPEIGLGPLVSLTLEAIDVNDNQRDYGIQREAFVPTLTVRPFRQISAQLGASGEYNNVKIFNTAAENNTSNLLRAPTGKTVAVAQRLSFTADYRDVPLNATRGFLVSTAVEHVNAFPLGGTTVSESHFLRFTGRLAGYLRLTSSGVALAASVGVGYNLQLFKASRSYPDRLFFLGGVDSLRAFLADSVVPQDTADAIYNHAKNANGKRLTVDDIALRGGDASINPRFELRIPINDTFATGIFLDTGNVWVDAAQIRAVLRYALGAGVRIGTPIGPIALDYGINLIKRVYLDEDRGAFHFSIGLF